MNQRKRRIGFFIDAYKPGAGTENQLRGILQHLDPNRFEAVLVTLRESVPEQYRAEIPWPVECLHVGSLHSPTAVSKFPGLVLWLRRQRLDIAMIFFLDTNRYVVPACFLAGVKNIVINRRDMGYWYTPSTLRLLNLINRMADQFMVNSEAVKALVIEKERFRADRIKVIYNGLWELGSSAQPVTREQLGIPTGSKVVGIVANLRPVKRVDRFLEVASLVAKEVPDCRFLILGQGELEAQLKFQAKSLGLGEQAMFLGQISGVTSYLRLFGAGLLTSDSEGFSNTLMEYALAGVPAVAFDTGGNREIIRQGETGFLVPNDDIPKMAAKVVNIIADNELKRRMSAAGQSMVVKRFAPDEIMRELMAYFDDMR